MPTIRQKIAFKKTVENGGNVSKAMRDAKYGKTSKNPKKLTQSKGWQELMDEYLPEKDLARVHKELTLSTKVDHMVFPLGPEDEDDINFSGAKVFKKEKEDTDEAELPEPYKERTTLTDKEIIEMLAEVNCKVRRIVHGETARHVYFWAPDSKARKDGLDMAYKLRGSYAPDKKEISGELGLASLLGFGELDNKKK